MFGPKVAWILLGAVGVMAAVAFAYDERVDFHELMRSCADLTLGEERPFEYLDPMTADNNENGILDVTEFRMLSRILADPTMPNRNKVRKAYEANVAQAEADLGQIPPSIVPNLKYVLGAYATLGDGGYRRDVSYYEGSWGIVAYTIAGLDGVDSGWSAGAPDNAKYARLESLLSACGDADGDGVNNIGEFNGQGKDEWKYSDAVLDAGIKIDGGDEGCICGGTKFGKDYFFNPNNGNVYHLTPYAATWTDAQAYAENHEVEGVAVPGDLATVRSQEESDWLVENVSKGETCWIGFHDATGDGAFGWVSGETATYRDWNWAEPAESNGERYAEMTYNGGWNAKDGAAKNPGIVEFVGPYTDADKNGAPDWWEQLSAEATAKKSLPETGGKKDAR